MGCVIVVLATFTSLILLSGLALVGLVSYVIVREKDFHFSGSKDLDVAFVVVAAFLSVTGLFGCCGITFRDKFSLRIYFGLILILFLVQIGGAIFIGTQQNKLEFFLVKTWSELEDSRRIIVQDQDCLRKLKKWLKSNIYVTAGSAGALAMIEILVLVCLVIVIRSTQSSAANNSVDPINVQPNQQEHDLREKKTNQGLQSTRCRSPNYGSHDDGFEEEYPPRKLWQPQRKDWAKKGSRSAGLSTST